MHHLIPLALLALTPANSEAPSASPAPPDLALLAASAVTAPSPSPAAPDDEEEPKHDWIGSVTLGGTIQDGNTKTATAAFTADAHYLREKDRTTLSAFLNYGEDKNANTITERKYGGKAQYDYFFSEKLYVLGTGRAEHDLRADVDVRWIVGGGAGYQFVQNDRTSLSGEVGLSSFHENFISSADKDYISARAAYNLAHRFNESVGFAQFFEVYPSLEDTENIYSKLDSRLDVSLTKSMFTQLQWVWDWNNNPAPGFKTSDHRFQVNFGWGF